MTDISDRTAPPARVSNIAKIADSIQIPLIYFGSIGAALIFWEYIALNYFSPAFFPTPTLVLTTAWEMIKSGELFVHSAISLQRIMLGFLIGSAVAIPLGLLMGSSAYVRAIFEPYTEFFRYVPAIAWLTPVVLWFGIGEVSKVLIIVYTTVFIVAINTIVGVGNISPNKFRAAASLGATPAKMFVYVTWPATLPFVLTGMRLAMGNSFATVVSAEMVAADRGLGFLIFNSRLWMATDKIFVAILCLGGLGMAADRIFRILIRRFAHQYGSAE
ncbi:ABC transporter permease [Microbaculum sp. FT89]|uniref:ABC transporter permease n=1 Tax=Microbaculum sp. FT89 TaxID=3447298 RepID=UPI003F538E0A